MKILLASLLVIGLAVPASAAETLRPSSFKTSNSNITKEERQTSTGNRIITPEEHKQNIANSRKPASNSFFSSDTTVTKNADGTMNLKKVLKKTGHNNVNKAWAAFNE